MALTRIDVDLLEAALVGLAHRRAEIDRSIEALRKTIGKRPLISDMTIHEIAARSGRPSLSASARRRIGEAQRRRWDAYRKAKMAPKKQAATPAAADQAPATPAPPAADAASA